MTISACAIILAAGAGRRMGLDKALLDLGGTPAIELALAAASAGGCTHIVVVRAEGAAPLPARVLANPRVRVVAIAAGLEMVESARAGISARPSPCDACLVLPVDHALVRAATIAAVIGLLATSTGRIVLPALRGRVGHPIGLPAAIADEVHARPTLRDVVRADAARVAVIPVDDHFVVHDLDTPADLEAARAWLRAGGATASEVMRAHRSRRAYAREPVSEEQLRWLVDCARHASTSSMMQAYSVVALRDRDKKAEAARLCADQEHIRQAPLFLAICADLRKIEAACARFGKRLQSDGLEIFLQSTIDAALLAQNLALAAESEGLGICMIGAARNHPVALARLLELPRHVYVAFGMTIGFSAEDPIPRGRMPLPSVLHQDRYDEGPVETALDGADELARTWARRTNAERGGYQGKPVSEERGWCERMARLWGDSDGPKQRSHLRVELKELGFGLD